jgi:hypothetical protein
MDARRPSHHRRTRCRPGVGSGDGSTAAETIVANSMPNVPSIAPDDDTLVFASASGRETGLDLWTASLKTHVAKPCVATRFAEDHPRYSLMGVG